MFHLLSAYLAFLDLITTSSWFISPKYHTSYLICSIQEYLFQGSLLCKSFTTLAICILSCHVIYTMTIPSLPHIFLLLFLCNLLGIICLIISILLHSSEIFCSNIELDDIPASTLHGYINFTIIPLYICVLLNLIIYIAIRYKISSSTTPISSPPTTSSSSSSLEDGKQQHTRAAGSGLGTGIGTEISGDTLLFQQNQQKLLQIVRRMLFYPLLFGICLLPEAALLFITLFTHHIPTWLYYLAASFIGMMGTMVTLNYFSRQTDHPNRFPFRIFSIFTTSSVLDSQGGGHGAPGIIIGRNLSSLLWWGSSAPPPQDRESQSDYDGNSDRYTSNASFPRYTDHPQPHPRLNSTEISNPINLYPNFDLVAAASVAPPETRLSEPRYSEQRFSEVELSTPNQLHDQNKTQQHRWRWRGI
jgi:hypothetical protein